MEDREGSLRWLQEPLATHLLASLPQFSFCQHYRVGEGACGTGQTPSWDSGSRTSWEKCWLSWSSNARSSGSSVAPTKPSSASVLPPGTSMHIHM